MLLEQILNKRNDLDLLNIKPFEYVVPYNYDIFERLLLESINNKLLIHIPTDDDGDGLVSSMIIYNCLNDKANCSVEFHSNKTHGLTDSYVNYLIKSGGLVLVTDAGINDVEHITKLLTNNIKVIIIDHHLIKTVTPIHKNLCVISTRHKENYKIKEISAGFLTFLTFYNFMKRIYNTEINEYFDLATLSIVSDVCSMRDSYNRSIMRQYRNNIKRNQFLSMFINDYNTFNTSLLGFNIAPKINMMFRLNRKDILSKLYTTKYDSLKDTTQYMSDVHTNMKKKFSYILNTVKYLDIGNMYLAVLDNKYAMLDEFENYIVNFTGLIANKLTERLNKPVLCIVKTNKSYKASVRSTNVNVFNPMQQLSIDGGGHPHACGFNVPLMSDIKEILQNYNNLLGFAEKEQVYNVPVKSLVELRRVSEQGYMREIAEFNEYSGNEVTPVGFLYKIKYGDFIDNRENYSKITSDSITFTTFNQVKVGDVILICPTLGKSSIEMLGNIVEGVV